MSESNDPICPECGLPVTDRVHLEGRNGIHERGGQSSSPSGSAEPPPQQATRAELAAQAEALGIEINRNDTRARILELIAEKQGSVVTNGRAHRPDLEAAEERQEPAEGPTSSEAEAS